MVWIAMVHSFVYDLVLGVHSVEMNDVRDWLGRQVRSMVPDIPIRHWLPQYRLSYVRDDVIAGFHHHSIDCVSIGM